MAVKKIDIPVTEAFALVAFPLPLEMDFAYKIPPEMRDILKTGMVVSAPFRRSIKTGFITGFTDQPPPGTARSLQDILLEIPMFNPELFAIAEWMSKYYFTSKGDILQVMQPVRINRESVELISLSENGLSLNENEKRGLHKLDRKILEFLRKKTSATPEVLKREVGYFQLYSRIDSLKRRSLIDIVQAVSEKEQKPRTAICIRTVIDISDKKANEVFSRAPAQKELYSFIKSHSPVSRVNLLKKFPGKESALKSLIDKGIVEKFDKEFVREFQMEDEMRIPGRASLPEMTDGQSAVVEAVEKGGKPGSFAPYLLHGVTGSGKTRVYFELIHNSLDRGEGALFLVPEIALTNYFLKSLREQFGNNVAVLHSRMSAGERFDSWRGIVSGEKRLVIGPRSAVFAPVKNLGIIIVDEEHDHSYKQHESPPYYHARDVAVYRASVAGARLILGSATPSMESYYNAESGKYSLLELPDRIKNTPMPKVELIDINEVRKNVKEQGRKPDIHEIIFSPALLSELEIRLKRDEQALLMLNRRGFSTFIQCRDCGYIEMCPDCKITLTFHKKSRRAVCHFCGFAKPAPAECPDCKSSELSFTGFGTQQIEEALHTVLPGFKTSRMDQDTTRSKTAHRRITSDFDRGESDILVGTQMVAKGFDFARVNMVGVISADTGLLIPEFRAAERTFQLMTQAAGRAGRRDDQGKVLIQTRYPENESLTAAVDHDFHRFYRQEAVKREELNYPPFGRIILLRFFSEDEGRVIAAASDIGKLLRKSDYRKFVLGPAPAPIEKLRKMYRWMIFLKSGKSDDHNGGMIRAAAQLAREVFSESTHKKGVAMTIDVDPLSLL